MDSIDGIIEAISEVFDLSIFQGTTGSVLKVKVESRLELGLVVLDM